MREIAKARSGRPPKFLGPRRPVTVTLPESTLELLASIDPDRGRAIVKATEAAVPLDKRRKRSIEVVAVAAGLGIILIPPCPLLQKIPGVRLVEVAPARFLLSIPLGTSIDSLELAITDLLEEVKGESAEHEVLTQLKSLIRSLRRRGVFSKAEMLLIDTRALPDRRHLENKTENTEPPIRQTGTG